MQLFTAVQAHPRGGTAVLTGYMINVGVQMQLKSWWYADLEAADCPIQTVMALLVVLCGERGAVGKADLTSAPTVVLLSPLKRQQRPSRADERTLTNPLASCDTI